MNDQFADLYHRAWACADFEKEYKENPTYERKSVVALEIFGEFIVRECAKFADGETNPVDGYTIGKAMLKHFGVK